MAYLDKHSTLNLVMISVVSSIPSGGQATFLLTFFKPFDVNSGLKCKCDLIVKNSMGEQILEFFSATKWSITTIGQSSVFYNWLMNLVLHDYVLVSD